MIFLATGWSPSRSLSHFNTLGCGCFALAVSTFIMFTRRIESERSSWGSGRMVPTKSTSVGHLQHGNQNEDLRWAYPQQLRTGEGQGCGRLIPSLMRRRCSPILTTVRSLSTSGSTIATSSQAGTPYEVKPSQPLPVPQTIPWLDREPRRRRRDPSPGT